MSNIKKLTPKKESSASLVDREATHQETPDAEPFFQDIEEEKIAALMASYIPSYEDRK